MSLELTVELPDGTLLQSNVGQEPVVYVQGDPGVLPALQQALLGMKKGETRVVTLSPEEAYGPVDPRLVVEVPLEQVPESARKAGAVLEGRTTSGKTFQAVVKEVREKTVVVDANHPLAGKTLEYHVKVVAIEKAG